MTIKYPRMPTGPSAPGAAGVRALQTAGGDWQQKRPNSNTVSKQQGEFQRVIVQPDGWVSCGKVERSSLTALQYVTPSWRINNGTSNVKNRRGPSEFADLSLQTNQDRAIAENPIAYLGDGRTFKLEYDGEMMEGSTTTANLKLKGSYLSYGSGKLVSGILANDLPDFIPGAKSGGKWYAGVAHDMLSPTASNGYYTGFQIGGDAWRAELPAISSGPLKPLTRRPTIHRVSPLELIGFVPGFESSASGPRGSQLVYSADNGQNWVYAYDGSTILTDRDEYSPSNPYAWDSDASVFEMRDRFLAARLPETGIVIAVVGEGAYDPTAIASKLRIYQLGEGGTTLLAQEVPIGPTGQYSTVFKHGGHHHGRPFMQFVHEDSSTHYLWFVKPDGSGADFFAMPQPSHWTGRARALDEKTIQCPMYYQGTDSDPAGYYICTSEDFGQTWKKLRLIKEDAAAPTVITLSGYKVNHTLQAFADAFLPRRYGQPSDTYPGAPYVGDLTKTQHWTE